VKTQKIIAAIIIAVTSSSAFAGDVINCYSSKTGYTYDFDIAAKTVRVMQHSVEKKSAEGISFISGHGEDILYVIESQGRQIGIISGEEKMRGTFSHGIFESRLNDRFETCERMATMIESRAARTCTYLECQKTGIIIRVGSRVKVLETINGFVRVGVIDRSKSGLNFIDGGWVPAETVAQ